MRSDITRNFRYHLRNKKVLLLSYIVLLLALSGCQVYHNTTARYNGYYYGRLKLNKVVAGMSSSLEDDYTKLLPLNKDEAEGKGPANDLDSVITKLTVVTELHPKSKWVDDCYFLIGKSYYYKKDYEAALATNQFIVATFKDKTSASSKKKKKKKGTTARQKKNKIGDVVIPWPKQPKPFTLSHQPVRNEAMLWLLKSYIKLKKYDEAKAVINVIYNNSKFPYELRDEFELITAGMLIEQKKYKEAIEPLRIAIALTKNRKNKIRYTYILAQLYQMTQNSDKAIDTYKEVLKLKPNYKMEFYAKINIANSFSTAGKSSSREILNLLEKMSRDDKYEEFRDQIYYAIAQIYQKQNDKANTIKNLKLAIENSTVNLNQKGMAYLQLAEMDFAIPDYISAKQNYDSAVFFISKTTDNYDDIKKRANILDRLVDQINTIEREDSLQKIASMDEKARNKFLDELIQKQEEEAYQDSIKNTLPLASNFKPQTSGDEKGGWYFYNAAAKGTGFNDFKKRWNNRPNEDNWRRSNKKSDIPEQTSGTNVSTTKNNSSGKTSRDNLLKDIPLTPEQLKASDERIAFAYYTLAGIYKDELNNRQKAIDTYEKLIVRFPDDSYALPSEYALYVLYGNAGNTAKADYYKQLILKEHLESNFAKIIKDPEYVRKSEKLEDAVNDYYEATFNSYQSKNYSSVIESVQKSHVLYKPNPIAAKFDLLEAFSIGQTQSRDSFRTVLKKFVLKYPTGEEQEEVKKILALMDKADAEKKIKESQVKKDNTTTEPKEKINYQFRPNNPHTLVILFTGNDPGIKSFVDSLTEFNQLNYSLLNYSISPTMVFDTEKKQQIVTVRQMKNSADAMTYYEDLSEHETFFENTSNVDHYIFVIDDKNFPLFFKSKNLQEYLDFFDKNYK